MILNDLSDIFDQTLQVQKRKLIKNVLVTIVKRVCELRKELCEIEMSDHIYMDHTLITAHLTPPGVVLNQPNNFPMKRPDEYNEIINKYLQPNESVESNIPSNQIDHTLLESVKTKSRMYQLSARHK